MKTISQQKRTPWRATVRMVAIAFLLFAGADLAFPQVCGEEAEALFPSQGKASTTFAHEDDSGEPAPHAASTEDCFCCCSHIVSDDGASPLGKLAILTAPDLVAPPSVPLAPQQRLFHPPRLA